MTPPDAETGSAPDHDAAALLAEIRRRGVRVWNVGTELHHACPEGTLGEDDRRRIATVREEILALLLAEHEGDDRDHPLTRTQGRFSLGRPNGRTGAGDHVRLVHRLRGPLDLEALESAFQELVIRQSALRTAFLRRDGEVVQRVRRPERFRLERRSVSESNAEQIRDIVRETIAQPLALEAGRPFRATVLVVDEKEHLLVIVGHHAILDRWSTSVLLNELSELHARAASGRVTERRPEAPRFTAYADEMAAWEESEGCRAHAEAWRSELAPDTVASLLPCDHSRDRDRRVTFHTLETVIEEPLATRLAERGRRWRCGTMPVLQAIIGCLVARATGRSRVTTGLSLGNRTRAEFEHVIGNFGNESLVQVDVDPERGFEPVLRQVEDSIRRATSRLDTPFERVAKTVGLPRIGRRHLAVPIFTSFHDRRRERGLVLDGVTVERIPDQHLNTFQEVGFHIVEHADAFSVRVEYDGTIFDRPRLQALLDTLLRMLDRVLEGPETPVGDLPFDAGLARGLGLEEAATNAEDRGHVEPASLIETRLAEVWTELLGVHPVGRFDDFFALGGSSLSAVRLLDRTHQVFGVALGVDALLSSPTLHELAARIQRSGRQLLIERSIRITGGDGDGLPTVFCLPGIGGLAAFTFRDIGGHLKDRVSLVGLQMKGLDGLDEPDHSIEAVGATMIDEILSIQHSGPYHLCGYSYGGTLAIEIAHRLRAAGHEVPTMVLVDTYPPGYVSAHRRFLRKMRLRVDGIRPQDQSVERDEFDPILPEDDPVIARLEKIGGLGASIKRTIEATREAGNRYRPRPYPGDVDVVRATPATSTPTEANQRFERLWRRWIKGTMTMHDVPVPHLDLVRTGSRSVAEVIDAAVGRSERALR